MIDINFESFEEIDEGLGFIEANEFFNKIRDRNIIVKNVTFENIIYDGEEEEINGCEFSEIIDYLKGYEKKYKYQYIEVIKDNLENKLTVELILLNTYNNENIRYEWLII